MGRRGILVPLVRLRRRLRRRRTQPFGYYTSMVQHIEFIIHTNIQPLRQFFVHSVKVIGQRSRSKIKRNSRSCDNLKNNFESLQFFTF